MSRGGLGGAALAASTLLSLAGCAHAPPRDLDTYLPLAVGNEWVYDQTGIGGHKTETLKIVSTSVGDRGETRYHVDASGEHFYVRDPHAGLIAYSVSVGIWSIFLRNPLTLGARYDAGLTTNEGFHEVEPDGRIVPTMTAQRPDQAMLPIPQSGYKVVTGFDRAVTVPAGSFHHCLEVTHLAGNIVGVKYFAPHVGMVLSEAWLDRGGSRSLFSRRALTSFRVGTAGAAAAARGKP